MGACSAAVIYYFYMKLGNVKIWVIVLSLALIGITVFILSNSLLDFEASHSSSGAIIDTIMPDGTKDVLIDDKTVEYYVRKAAHFLEYSLLGFAAISLSFVLTSLTKQNVYVGFSLFYVLAIAVLDEHIQSLSDRSSSTFDILLDFSGSLFGILLSSVIFFCIYRSKYGKKQSASV